MLSRKYKPVLHPQRQRSTLADRSLEGFGGKSWNPQSKTSASKDFICHRNESFPSPGDSLYFPSWPSLPGSDMSLWCLPSWESGGVRRPLLTWSAYSTCDGQISKPDTVLHGTAGSVQCGHQSAWALVEKKERTERGRELYLGSE